MFGNDSKIQLAVLQERFKAHEQIIEKVDTAIQTLSETNQNICKMLTVHDERINTQKDSDNNISKRVDGIETKLEDFIKFRWILVGIATLAVFAISQSSLIVDLLTPNPQPAKVEIQK